MMPVTERGIAERAKSGRKRAPRRAPPDGRASERPLGRVMQLVAALKAEQDAGSPLSLAADPAERVKLLAWLRRFLAVRDAERSGWETRIHALEVELAQTCETVARERAAAEQAAAQQERLLADLRLLHEHQRSIWQLERRQLEIALGALEKRRQRSLLRQVARLARPALAAALLLISLTASALSVGAFNHSDGGPAGIARRAS
jgi:hypothetical protein